MKSHASMNRIYRLVWNQVLNAWVAVAETAKGRGKGSSRKLIAAALSLSGIAALAGPQGGQVVSGAGAISQSGNTTTINQTSQNLSLSWQSFNVAKPETVNFVQPSASAIAVNRIFDTNASQILGHLNANGQVYLINPNGILFGQGAQVNVGGLVASTLDLSDTSLTGNSRSFSGKGTGSVVNQGTINAGYGGYVALLGNHVSNQGVITAQLGTVALGAGSAATLTFNGNSLVKMQVDQSTLNNLVENGGLIRADGGMVIMNAAAKDALLASVVNNSGVIEARTVENHEGSITLLGGMTAGTVNVGGTLDASAPTTGNGGFIETSAAHVKVADTARITTQASNGLNGTWLIDPVDFTIAATGGDITGAALSTSLAMSGVTILSSKGGLGTAGDVNVNDGVTWSANTLTLNAQNNININAAMNGSGTASLALQYGQSSTTGGTSSYNVNAVVNLPTGNNFSTQLGSTGTPVSYTVITALGAAGSTTTTDLQGMSGGLALNYVLGANIDACLTGGNCASGATSVWNTGAGFSPIGTTSTRSAFTGIFDGLGHTISNLTINRPSMHFVGLFGYTYKNAVIRNVGLVGGSVRGSGWVGALVGNGDGSTAISNSYATSSVNGDWDVGGLIGDVNALVTVSNSYASGNVTGTSSSSEVGGLVGINNGGMVSNSYATGIVKGASQVGGLVGKNNGTVSNSFWNTQTSGQATSAGGTGLTTAQMQTQSSFTGWDFTTPVWRRNPAVNNGYPCLAWSAGCVSASTQIYLVLVPTSGTTYASVYGSTPGLSYVYDTSATYDAAGVVASSLVVPVGTPSTTGAPTATSNVRIYTVTPSISGITGVSSAYTLAAGNAVTWSVTPAPLTVTGTTVANKTYDGGTKATLSGGTLLGTVNGDSLTLTQAGSFASKNVGTGIKVTAADTFSGTAVGNYTLTQPGSLAADITSLAVTLTAPSVSKTYDGGLSYTATAGNLSTLAGSLLAGDTITAATIAYTNKNAGTGTKTVSLNAATINDGNSGNNYSVTLAGNSSSTITPLAITVAAAGANKVYDAGVNDAPTLSSTGVISGDTVTFASTSATFADKNVGNAKTVSVAAITASGTDAGNYTLNNTSATTTANITSASLSITGISANKVYDGTKAATLNGTATVTALGTDVVTLSGSGVGSFADKNAGTGKAITLSGYTLIGADASNYSMVAPTSLVADITPKALTVSGITASAKVYDGSTAATVNAAQASYTGLIAGDLVTTTSVTGAFADKNVGKAKTVSLTANFGGADAGNYSVSAPTSLSASVTPKALSVNGISASDKVYDGTTAATVNTAAASLTGLVSGDVLNVKASGTFSDKNAATAKSVTLASSYAGTDAGNYAITDQTSSTASITPKALTVAASGSNKVYDGSVNDTVSLASTDVIGGDAVKFSNTTASFADKNAALGKTVSVAGISVSGADAGNYSVSNSTASTNADITPKALSVSGISASNKVYDGTTAATVNTAAANYTGLIAGDVVTTRATGAFADKNVGNAKTVSLTANFGGADAGNYSVSAPAGLSASITPKALSVSGISASDKVYDGGTAATVNTAAASLTGLVSGDVLNVKASGTFSDKNAATGKTVSLASSYSGADVGNYAISDQASSTASITTKALSVSGLTASDKVYDGTTAATVNTAAVSLNGLVSGDLLNVKASGTFADKNVGTAKSVTLASSYAGADAGNYAISDQASSSASITPATLTYLAAPASFFVGQTPSGLSGSVNGFVSGDTLTNASSGTLAWSSPVTTTSLAAQYAINGAGLSAANYVFTQAADNASALSLQPGTPPEPVLNATTQLVLNVLSPQANVRPDALILSPTITVTQGTSLDKGDTSTNTDTNGGAVPVLNVAMNIGSNGPALQIINGGMRLPTHLVNVNE